ncbi:hypothetical protein DPMN_155323 [Dreissena polymorpha]|uniref:Uncharacterized protein n=1 Tax=Dreissena polymorpha TaxID=45954 RepID=A0A9D4J7S2_DREPO|nr:hypothetical protein DPMN_155323 [Dreissena polymorpha]
MSSSCHVSFFSGVFQFVQSPWGPNWTDLADRACSFTFLISLCTSREPFLVQLTEVRNKERERLRDSKVTGGGPPTVILKDWQEKFLRVLPKVTIEGFKFEKPSSNDFGIAADEERILEVKKEKLELMR